LDVIFICHIFVFRSSIRLFEADVEQFYILMLRMKCKNFVAIL